MMAVFSQGIGLLLRLMIRVYQYVFSPVLGANCRYQPTCSQYAYDAVVTHGPVKGGWLAARRVCRCHPWGGAGYDPVPTAGHDPQQG